MTQNDVKHQISQTVDTTNGFQILEKRIAELEETKCIKKTTTTEYMGMAVLGLLVIAVLYGITGIQKKQTDRDQAWMQVMQGWYSEMKLQSGDAMPEDVLIELGIITEDYQSRMDELTQQVEKINEKLITHTDDRWRRNDQVQLLEEIKKLNPELTLPELPNN
jgi:uncharacterized coiled-coil protein SlyX